MFVKVFGYFSKTSSIYLRSIKDLLTETEKTRKDSREISEAGIKCSLFLRCLDS